jgi:outer membrane receptor protein involved in Fe transport
LLSPGNYTLTAEMPGFATITIDEITLQASINSALEIILQPKTVNESIEVKARSRLASTSSPADVTNATTSYSISNEQVISLPVLTTSLGRNTLGVLAFIVPGVAPATALGPAEPDSNRKGNQMSINGARPTSISFNLDGGDNNDHELNQALGPLPNPDALQEFTILTNNYQADTGRSLGGVVNAVVKSGTNDFAGGLRYLMINERLNARGFFDPRVPIDRMYTFGGQAGGPLRVPGLFDGAGRAFFFADYEGTRSSRESLSTLTVPTKLERIGDFSALPPAMWPRDPLNRKHVFSGGIIPADRINPIARAYMDRFIPLPNSGERNFSRLLLTGFENDQFTARVDYKLGAADNLSATFFRNNSDINEETASLPVGSRTNSLARNQNLILRQTHVFSPRAVSQLTAVVTRLYDTSQLIAPGATGTHPSEIGFTGIHPQTDDFLGVPSINIIGTGASVVTGQGRVNAKTTWQIKDDVSLTTGNHVLKFGGEVRAFLQNSTTANNNGSFNFFPNAFAGSGNAIANFLLGVPFSYTQTSGGRKYLRQRSYYLYVMDDVRPRQNLTLNLGLRYELAPPIKDELDQVNVFRPGQQSERFPEAPTGLLFAGDPDPILGTAPRGGYATDANNFAPRLGLAYSPEPETGLARAIFGQGVTVIRVGAGLFYDHTLGQSFSQQSSAQPYSITQTLTLSQMSAFHGNFADPFGMMPSPWPLDLTKGIFTTTPEIQPFDPRFRTAYSYHYNLTIQRELPFSLLMEIAYVGSNSFKLNRERELNAAELLPGASIIDVQFRRRFPNFSRIPSQESTGRARFDSLQTRISRRLSNGLSFDLSYVYGKSLDDGSGTQLNLNGSPSRWARSDFDRMHNFVASYGYSPPSTRYEGVLGAALNGWQIAGITEFRSGQPIDIFQDLDSTLTAAHPAGSPDLVSPFIKYDPREVRTLIVNGAPVTGNFFFDPTSFKVVDVGNYTEARLGTLGRNVFDGPGMSLWSFSAIKRFKISESQQLTLRSDVRNLFNRALFQMRAPSLRANSLSFGQVVSAAPGRNIQLSIRYIF